MVKRFSCIYKLITVLLLFTVIYDEYVSFTVNSLSWAKLKCKNQTSCVKILLVADPQLIGEENEIFHFITPLSIWDSDRYLAKTYAKVVNHMQPDVVIFLGDLLDEGSIATTVQFIQYLRRLFTIFSSTEYPVKHIWLPGDNDIGGETDRVTEHKIKRFNRAFSQPSVINIKHVKFSKINRMEPEMPKSLEFIDNNSKQISVLLSHMPIIPTPALFVDKVLELLKPKLIFSAHEHKSKLMQVDREQQSRKIQDLNEHNKIYEYKLDNSLIYEILVPTCSYRMGTNHVGYGGAIIEGDGKLQYTVFWSPNRFVYLLIYLSLLGLLFLFLLLQPLLKICLRQKTYRISKTNFKYKIIKNGV